MAPASIKNNDEEAEKDVTEQKLAFVTKKREAVKRLLQQRAVDEKENLKGKNYKCLTVKSGKYSEANADIKQIASE